MADKRPPVAVVDAKSEIAAPMNGTKLAIMRPMGTVLVIALIVVGATTLGHAQSTHESSQPVTDNTRLSITKDVMDSLVRDHLSLVREHFCVDLQSSLTEDDLKRRWDEVVSGSGTFQKHLSQTPRTVNGEGIYIAKSQFENFTVEVLLTFNEANQITDLSMVPLADVSAETMEATAKAVVQLLEEGQFDLLNARLTDDMKDRLPPEELEANWVHVLRHLGEFQSVKTAMKDPDMDLVNVTCHFENGDAKVRIAFDPLGRVRWLWISPVESSSSPSIPEA